MTTETKDKLNSFRIDLERVREFKPFISSGASNMESLVAKGVTSSTVIAGKLLMIFTSGMA